MQLKAFEPIRGNVSELAQIRLWVWESGGFGLVVESRSGHIQYRTIVIPTGDEYLLSF